MKARREDLTHHYPTASPSEVSCCPEMNLQPKMIQGLAFFAPHFPKKKTAVQEESMGVDSIPTHQQPDQYLAMRAQWAQELDEGKTSYRALRGNVDAGSLL